MYPSVSNYDMYHENHFCRNPVALFFCLPIVFLGSERRKTSFGRYWVVVFSGGGGVKNWWNDGAAQTLQHRY